MTFKTLNSQYYNVIYYTVANKYYDYCISLMQNTNIQSIFIYHLPAINCRFWVPSEGTIYTGCPILNYPFYYLCIKIEQNKGLAISVRQKRVNFIKYNLRQKKVFLTLARQENVKETTTFYLSLKSLYNCWNNNAGKTVLRLL